MKTEQEIAEEVAPSSLQALFPPGVKVSRVSLQFTAEASEETYLAVNGLLNEAGESQLYHVGDYLNHLYEAQGEKVARKLIEDSYAPETRRKAAWVCRRVTPQRRLLARSFSHAEEVAKLEPTEQELWLTQARDENWNRQQLRAALRQRAAIGNGAPSQVPADEPASKASMAFEVFRAWYQAHSPQFTGEQRAEWNEALLPLVTDHVAHLSDEDFAKVCAAREIFATA